MVMLSVRTSWRTVGVYGWPKTGKKFKTWDFMRFVGEWEEPIFFGEDFNEVLSMDEVEGSSAVD